MVVLGVLFGSAVSANFIDHFVTWLPSMISVIIYVIATTGMLTAYLILFGKYNFATSLFSSAPGGLIPMTLMGQSYNGDDRVIAIMQSLRLILTVLTIPVAFRIFTGYVPSGDVGTGGSFAAFLPQDVLPTICACLVGYFLAVVVRLPAPSLMGPMIAIGLMNMKGWIQSDVPDSLVAVSQLIIGISVALRFNGTRLKEIQSDFIHGSISSIIMICLAVLFAILTAQFTSSSAEALILAFAPGGFAEMALIGFGLGVEISFVISHQLVRYFFIVLSVPLLMLLFKGRPVVKDETPRFE